MNIKSDISIDILVKLTDCSEILQEIKYREGYQDGFLAGCLTSNEEFSDLFEDINKWKEDLSNTNEPPKPKLETERIV